MSESKLKKKLQEQSQPEIVYEGRNYNKLFLGIIILIVLVVGGLFLYNHIHSKHKSATTSSSSTYGNAGFTVDFPFSPTVSSNTQLIDNKRAPFTSYDASNAVVTYYVRKYDLTNALNLKNYNANNIDDLLIEWIDKAATSSKWTVGGTNITKVAGATAGSGVLTDSNNPPNNVYFYDFLKGETMYNVATIGVSQSDSNSFINSFKFTK